MQAKLFEIRDRGTFFPMLAVKLDPANEAEHYLIRRAGFMLPSQFVLAGRIEGGEALEYDIYEWGTCRTRPVAHEWIAKHFDALEPGAVICVETILGERETPKTSERLVDGPFYA